MTTRWRWDPCVNHRGPAATCFIAEYFGDPSRYPLLIAGAGFDPRSPVVSILVARTAGSRVRSVFVREDRPNPSQTLMIRADHNLAQMRAAVPIHEVARIPIFAQDGAVVGGRTITRYINGVNLSGITDVIVDCSALSIGVSFPLVRYLLSRVEMGVNLHLMVTHDPSIDAAISATASDAYGPVHGFMGDLGLSSSESKAKLWLPQLAEGQRMVLARIHAHLAPDDVCPILPFPSSTPRLADQLIEHYAPEFQSVWQVDAGDIIYAHEDNPLDLYRTILRMDDARRGVFTGIGGSIMVLSPIGSKGLAIGALMAAMERSFPVTYIEAVAYVADFPMLDRPTDRDDRVVHVWLAGDVYPGAVTGTGTV